MRRTFVISAVSVFVFVFGSLSAASYYSATKYAVNMETQIEAEYSNLQNVLGSYIQKVEEAVQVPDMYKDDLKDIIEVAMTSRYGDGGSGAATQLIFENYPGNLSTDMYVKVQQIIESGRNEFKNAQTRFLDIKRGYESVVRFKMFPSRGFWLNVSGYPTINLSEYDIVVNSQAKKGTSTSIKLRK